MMKQQRTSSLGRSEVAAGLKKESGNVEPNFCYLPGDALIEVFSRLPVQELLTSVPLVCKDWRNASLDPGCWKVVDLRPWFVTEPLDEDVYVLERDSEIESLEFQVKKLVDKSYGQMREFHTKFCSNEALEYIAGKCPSLVALSISESHFVNDDSAAKLVASCPKLERVDMSNCCKISSTSIETLGRNCKSLVALARNMVCHRQALPQDNGFFLSPEENVARCDAEALAISRYMVNLKHLDLQNTRLSNVGLSHIARGCPNLESLNLLDCLELTPDAVEDFSKKNPKVKLHYVKPLMRQARLHGTELEHSGPFFSGFF